jgi:alpha-beta hydrolase superfamily lysophospholipase
MEAPVIRFLLAYGLVLVAAVSSAAQSRSDEGVLPRRGWFGVALGPHDNGAVVTGLTDGSPAASAGVRAGDVIRAVDDTAVRAPEDVIAAIGRHAGGETAVIAYIRAGEAQKLSVVLRPFPQETMPGVAFEYGAVTLREGTRLRTIVSIPAGRGRFPAVMLLQGGGCGSVDVPLAPEIAQPGLVRTIAARGYVTMRVEKSGIGDSKGPPCAEIGYAQELEGYRAALAALNRHPSVDRDKVYLLGISLGGVFAPILAGENRIRGIVVYGTLASAPPPIRAVRNGSSASSRRWTFPPPGRLSTRTCFPRTANSTSSSRAITTCGSQPSSTLDIRAARVSESSEASTTAGPNTTRWRRAAETAGMAPKSRHWPTPFSPSWPTRDDGDPAPTLRFTVRRLLMAANGSVLPRLPSLWHPVAPRSR